MYDYKAKNAGLVPYVGGGIGISRTKVGATQNDNPPQAARSAGFAAKSDTNFAWNLVVGANYHYNMPTTIGFGYRYTDASRVTTVNNCLGTNAHICDADETHSTDFNTHLFFIFANPQPHHKRH